MSTEKPIFDILRLTGAALVIFGHSYALLGQRVPSMFGQQPHVVGVKLFFLVSGFLITASWLRDPHLVRFVVKRLLRVMPALIAVVALTALVLGPIISTDAAYFESPKVWTYVWRNIALLPYHELPGVFEGNPHPVVNGSLWTLPVEAFCYALTPVVLTLISNRQIAAAGYVAAAIVLGALTVDVEVMGFGLNGAAEMMPYFWMGAAYRLAGGRVPMFPLRALPADLSYGTYLMAFPVQQTIIMLSPGIGPLALIVLTLAVVLPAAWLSWRFVEQAASGLARCTFRLALRPCFKVQ